MKQLFFAVVLVLNVCFLSAQSTLPNCNNWLYLPSQPSYVDVGDLNITGDQLTVEAVVSRISPYTDLTSSGDIVSKHSGKDDANYLLRINSAEITTTNSYYVTDPICDAELNKTYHVAMVYDGKTLKFYRNGFLMSEVPATGDLLQSKWKTRIGFFESQAQNENFLGYINEVRIWNVARTQSQIRTYMAQSLPSPSTQSGLLAYYTFDDLTNKQGNPAWDGQLGGAASINETNPTCAAFIPDSCKVPDPDCSSWLSLPSRPSYMTVGDLTITGDQMTIEALVNRTTAYSDLTTSGDVVSKHSGKDDANYLLRINSAEITTTTGYHVTQAPCDAELNKTYHVAMVYDGKTLKFYRNGFLMSEVAATGNLLSSTWKTRIGYFESQAQNENFIGYIDEVRIWNVARTQSEIRANMEGSLPSPTTQTGLLAYYTFDDLTNKQGNTAWNGVLGGSASINAFNPTCDSYTADSCKVAVVIPDFTIPDTVCVNSNVEISNSSVGASSYYWSFCVNNLQTSPVGTNLGNPGGLNSPVYIDYVYEGGNYYGFVSNNLSQNLIRLDFGNSLLNAPTAVNLGNPSGVIPANAEGIQVIQNEGNWYVIMVGGDISQGVQSKIVKIELGTDITNTTPTGTSWGNIGNLAYPHDLYIFEDNNTWYGLTINSTNSTITRFNFSSSFSNTPTAVNLGNIGSLNAPTGLHAIQENGEWHAFIANADNSTLSRLDFGSSLLNTPTGVNLGNIDGKFHTCWDIYVMSFCGEKMAFVINADQSYNDILRLDFGNSITNIPTATSFGNTGNMNFPHCLSKVFRVGADLYTFIPNVSNNTITRLQFAGCTDASISSSAEENPSPVTYSQPGVYNINLTIDDGLPTQASICKQVVVTAPEVDFSFTQDYCDPTIVQFQDESDNSVAQYWDFGNGTTATDDPAPLVNYSNYNTYPVQLTITSSQGCTNSITKNISIQIVKDSLITNNDTSICIGNKLQLNAIDALSYCWSPATGLSATDIANPVATIYGPITYYVTAQKTGTNLVDNGDFSQGNTGFTSEYTFSNPNTTEGQYFVGTNPASWNGNFSSTCGDHTTGNGNMLLVNGSPTANANVWKQTITVAPNTNYAFAAWIQSLSPNNPAVLQFAINGVPLGNNIQASSTTCQWNQFYATWNSGNSTTAEISLININTVTAGNDFALDDISFAEVQAVQDSVVINGTDCGNLISGVINDYTEVTGFDTCTNSLLVNNANEFKIGDTVLIAQMKGAIIDTSNSANFGNILDYGNAGNYEYNYISDKNGNSLTLRNQLERTYDITTGKVQLVRVPYFKSVVITSPLSCLPWDGSKGGILALNIEDTLTLLADLDVSGKGFMGGKGKNINRNYVVCFQDEYIYPSTSLEGAAKGEGIANVLSDKSSGKGSPANGGGGGNEHNSGGGGGGNATSGGLGGYQLNDCGNAPYDNRGVGGKSLTYDNVSNKIFMGGGGGAGHCNNPPGFNSDGGNGGGIIIINAGTTVTNSNLIIASGQNAAECTPNGQFGYCHEGMGGGGGGGTVLLNVATYGDGLSLDNHGGKGADMNGGTYGKLGPGGGGSGGVCWVSQSSLPASLTINNDGGESGVNIAYNNDVWGATKGAVGLNIFDLKLPIDTTAFKLELALSQYPQDTTICSGSSIQLNADNGTLYNYQWSPATSLDAPASPTPTATPADTTYYSVLVSLASCNLDTTLKVTVNVNPSPEIDYDTTTTFCKGLALAGRELAIHNTISQWEWDFGDGAGALTQNEDHAYQAGGTYTIKLTATDILGCADSVSKDILVDTVTATITPDTTVCVNTTFTLNSSGGTIYSWAPAEQLNDNTIADPQAVVTDTTRFYVTVKNYVGCEDSTSVLVSVVPRPAFTDPVGGAICFGDSLTIGNSNNPSFQYQWSPADGLSDATTAAPNASPATDQEYTVAIQDHSVCLYDTTFKARVTVNPLPETGFDTTTTFCKTVEFTGRELAVNNIISSWQWSLGDGHSVDQQNLTYVYAGPGIYDVMLVATDINGCTDTTSKQVEIETITAAITPGDTLVCESTLLPLQGTGGTYYSWAPATIMDNAGSSTPQAAIGKTPVNVQLAISNDLGCTDTATINVSVINRPAFKKPDDLDICYGIPAPITSTNDVDFRYTWSPADGLNDASSPAPMASPEVTTDYQLYLEESTCGFDTSFTVRVAVHPIPTVTASSKNDITCLVPTTPLYATGAESYVWTPAGGVDQPYTANPRAAVDTTTMFVVKGTTSWGCENYDSVLVTVSKTGEPLFRVPNAFTPNNDGKNDCFGVQYWGSVKLLEFSIYNRWGQLIFTSKDQGACWDGRFKGILQETGGYVYVIRAFSFCGEIKRTGTVMLIK